MISKGPPPPAPALTAGVDPVTSWRQDQLLRAGYDEIKAALIASDRRIDLHQAVGLAHSAGPELAAQILL